MELPQEVDDHIKNSIDYTLGLPVPNHALQLKLQSLEASHHRLRAQYLNLQFKLKQKDETLECARAEACLNAQALKRFVEENQKLANECAHLVSQCSKWERECSLYDHDREALMEFGNEADERAKQAEIRVLELEEELRRVSEEAGFYKQEIQRLSVDSSDGCASLEQNLLDRLIASLINRDEVTKTAHAFLETNNGVETCQKLLEMWNCLRPGTQNILSLAAQVQILQKDKEHLRINLRRAEEEVKMLFEENNILDEENRRLLRQRNSERKHNGSGGKFNGSAKAKSNKRKSSPRMSSPVERKIDFSDLDSPRQPLSPLQQNSADSRMQKR
ncbi:hypothetical protein Ancab_036467 [Ancistrocladus abbreviatus]